MMKNALAVLLLLVAAFMAADACVHTYLTHPEMMAPHGRALKGLSGRDDEQDLGVTEEEAEKKPTWNYALNGADWDKVAEVCIAGEEQSPIHIFSDSLEAAPTEMMTSSFGDMRLGTIGNVSVINTGHSLQVEWLSWEVEPEAMVMVAGEELNMFPYEAEQEFRPIPVTPIQFHWHTPSEHVVDGIFYPAELHIVTLISGEDLPACGEAGCLSVFGVPYVLTEEDNPDLQPFLEDAPLTTLGTNPLSDYTLDLNTLLPDDLTYTTYAGSLTTPPCSEGVRWHFLLEAEPMSLKQFEVMQLAVSMATQNTQLEDDERPATFRTDEEANGERVYEEVGTRINNRLPQPLNGRTVYVVPEM